MRKNTVRMFVLSILSFMLICGTILGYRYGRNIAKENNLGVAEISINNEQVNEILNKEDINVNADIEIKSEYKIVKKTKYSLCKHEDYIEDTVIDTSIDKAIENVKEEYSVESKTDHSCILTRKLDGYCSHHFLITLEDKKIVVYKLLTRDKKEVHSTINVPVNTLREDVLLDLNKGIEVDSTEKLNSIIEELES